MNNQKDIKAVIVELNVFTFTKKRLLAHEYVLVNLNYGCIISKNLCTHQQRLDDIALR